MIDFNTLNELLNNVGKKYICVEPLWWVNGVIFERGTAVMLKDIHVSWRNAGKEILPYITPQVQMNNSNYDIAYEVFTKHFAPQYDMNSYSPIIFYLINNIDKKFICKIDVDVEEWYDEKTSTGLVSLYKEMSFTISDIYTYQNDIIIYIRCSSWGCSLRMQDFLMAFDIGNPVVLDKEKSK